MPYDRPKRVLIEMESGKTFIANPPMIESFVVDLLTDSHLLEELDGYPAKIPSIKKIRVSIIMVGSIDNEGLEVLLLED